MMKFTILTAVFASSLSSALLADELNPQPLPPISGESVLLVDELNPQPLPPIAGEIALV